MKDPIPPYKPLSNLIQPFADHFSLTTLPLHIHEVALAFASYHLIYLASPFLSTLFFRKSYPYLKPRTKVNWDVHVVSLVQSTFISLLAVYVMWADKERAEDEHRVFGYTGLGASVQAYALGYFLWDLMMSALHFDIFGPGFLAHAFSAVVVYGLGFRPFVNYYAPIFICFEFSSPFLNFHWFFDKLNMTGSRAQLYNGLTLLVVFFLCRVVYGPIMSYKVFKDVFKAYLDPPMTEHEGKSVPLWLLMAYLGSNTILNCLNFYWFTKMIDAVRKRFAPVPRKKDEKKVGLLAKETVVVEGTDIEVPIIDGDVVLGEGKKDL